MKKLFTVAICILIAISSYGQKTKKAEKAYNDGNYQLAIEEYNLLMEEEGNSQIKAQYRYYIGESYRKMNRPDRAEKPFLDAIKGGYMSGEIYRSLAEVQLKLGKYEDALSSFESYKRSNPFDPLADVGIASCKFAMENTLVNPFFTPQSLDRVNSSRSEIGVSYFNDGLIFTSSRSVASNNDNDQDDDKKEVFTRTGLDRGRVYMASGNNGTFGRAIEISELNKMKDFANDGVFTYDPYSRQGLYARTDNKKAYIQFMEFTKNKWVKTNRIEVDSQREPIGHPFLTPDGNRIYFTSTMPGGFGKSDIWYIERSGSGWSKPINAGDKINTAGNEVYPTIAGDYFIFSSDGHVGYGGFDIFAAKMVNGSPQEPYNLGHPFNSYADDYNMAIRTDLTEGVFVTGREVRKSDDIYYFKNFPSALIVTGTVVDAETGNGIPNATIQLKQIEDNKVTNKAVTGLDGKYSMYVEPEKEYTLVCEVVGYPSNTLDLKTDVNRFGKIENYNFKLSSNASVISGRVYDRNTFVSIESLDVSLIVNGAVVQTTKTNTDGLYRFGEIKGNTQYRIKTYPKDYFSDEKDLTTSTLSRNVDFSRAGGYDNDFALEPMVINKEVLMSKVEFPREKSELINSSFAELDRYARLFILNPQCKILISSYTDSRVSSTKAALDLTKDRADAVKNYLLSKGVSAEQISTKNLGRTRLLINNARSEEEHNRNNRITYTVTSIAKTDTAPVTPSVNTTKTTTSPVTSTTNVTNNAGTTTKPSTNTSATNTPATATASTDYASLPWRIQIMALKVLKTDDPLFKRIKSELSMEVRYALGADGYYRYYIGGFATREQAAAALEKLKPITDGLIKPSTAF